MKRKASELESKSINLGDIIDKIDPCINVGMIVLSYWTNAVNYAQTMDDFQLYLTKHTINIPFIRSAQRCNLMDKFINQIYPPQFKTTLLENPSQNTLSILLPSMNQDDEQIALAKWENSKSQWNLILQMVNLKFGEIKYSALSNNNTLVIYDFGNKTHSLYFSSHECLHFILKSKQVTLKKDLFHFALFNTHGSMLSWLNESKLSFPVSPFSSVITYNILVERNTNFWRTLQSLYIPNFETLLQYLCLKGKENIILLLQNPTIHKLYHCDEFDAFIRKNLDECFYFPLHLWQTKGISSQDAVIRCEESFDTIMQFEKHKLTKDKLGEIFVKLLSERPEGVEDFLKDLKDQKEIIRRESMDGWCGRFLKKSCIMMKKVGITIHDIKDHNNVLKDLASLDREAPFEWWWEFGLTPTVMPHCNERIQRSIRVFWKLGSIKGGNPLNPR